MASCTMSSASAGERASQRARLYAASRCGNACAWNLGRFGSMGPPASPDETDRPGILFPLFGSRGDRPSQATAWTSTGTCCALAVLVPEHVRQVVGVSEADRRKALERHRHAPYGLAWGRVSAPRRTR